MHFSPLDLEEEVLTEWKRKENRYHMESHETMDGLIYLTFPVLDQAENVRHLFSTRKGGVSKGIYESMNLSFHRGDNAEDVLENFRRIAKLFDSTPDKIVCARQTHTTNIRRVTKEDGGKGVTREPDYEDIDGLVTNEPGLILCTSFADCVPIYFVDPIKNAIGLAHSGWRGTVNHMGARMVEEMNRQFGSDPKDLLVAVGPSICVDCYEVGEDVADEFRRAFPHTAVLQKGKSQGKYQLDLWKANEQLLLEAGIPKDHLEITDLCTCCNPELLFSHRASHGQRGNLCAFLELIGKS